MAQKMTKEEALSLWASQEFDDEDEPKIPKKTKKPKSMMRQMLELFVKSKGGPIYRHWAGLPQEHEEED